MHTGPINTAWEKVSAPWQGFENRFEQYFPSVGGRGRTRNTFPGFAAFGESFQLGGGLNLPEDPAIALKCDGGIYAQYVKMNAYDFYTGHGFKKKPVDVTAQQADGNLYDPRVDQPADKPLPLPPAADQNARVNTCTAELYRPRGNILPVLGTQLEQANTDARLSLGWQVFTPTGRTCAAAPRRSGATATDRPRETGVEPQRHHRADRHPTHPSPRCTTPGNAAKRWHARDLRPERHDPDAHTDQYAAFVTRAQGAAATASAGGTTGATGATGTSAANSAKAPAITRIIVAEAPVAAPIPTSTPGAAPIASASAALRPPFRP